MSLQPPKLPTWIFFVTDFALIGAAGFIAYNAAHPLTETTTFAIVACAIAGAIVGLVPIVARYERRKNETLDQRQRELEALGRTISSSAEQISIAANGFNEITDLAHRNLKHAEQLPHKLQDKIAEFNSVLENAREDEREEMEKELAELRSSESERLQTIASQIHKGVSELTKLESIAQKQLAARTELSGQITESITKAQAEAARTLNEAGASFVRQLTELQTRLIRDLESKWAERLSSVPITPKVGELAPHAAPAASTPPENLHHSAPASSETNGIDSASNVTSVAAGDSATLPKRSKKPRKEEPIATEAAPNPSTAPAIVEPVPEPEALAPQAATVTHIVASPQADDAQPEAAEPKSTVIESAPTAVSAPERALKKKPAKKNGSEDNELSLGLSLDESPVPALNADAAGQDSEVVERVLTSDGATRLIATAYIGIGNRLFVRGNGPGLSWDKGVPLQFVSIGKWRWETAEAQTPVELKLYKNDEVECAALGVLKLDPGYQQEVTAKF